MDTPTATDEARIGTYIVLDGDDSIVIETRDYDEAMRYVHGMDEGEGGMLLIRTRDGWQRMIVWSD